MATYTFDKINYGGNTYVVSDSGALQLTGGQVTGPVIFGDSITVDEATLGDLVVNGSASFTNNIQANTINGVTVGSSPKFTDTNTEVSTLTLASGSTAGTSLSYGGKYTLTAGSKTVSFTMPASDNTNTTYTLSGALASHKVTSTLTAGGSGSGTSTSDFTLAAGTGISLSDNTSTRTITITNTVSNTNTTYTLSNALASHKFTETLTAGGSGSGTSTATMEFVAGTGITLTDDTTNKKLTIGCSVTSFSSTTATLTTAGWSSNAQTVSVTGVTASNTVIVSPAPSSYADYCTCGVFCSAQSAGTLTFTCSETPPSALTVNVLYK